MPRTSLEDTGALAMKSEGRAAEVERLIAPSLAAMGYGIVRVQISGAKRATLQIMAERQDLTAMTVDDCAQISRAVGAILDVDDPIAGPFVLEVSSPGIDRPLTRREDFDRFAGFEAKLETRLPVDGRRRFRGRLLGLDGPLVRLATDGGEIELPLATLAKARLLLTDELVAAGGSTDKN